MSNPQDPNLARSRKVPFQDQDAAANVADDAGALAGKGRTGPVPEENQPGHHPPVEQDKPDLEAFAARFGGGDDAAPASDDEVVEEPVADGELVDEGVEVTDVDDAAELISSPETVEEAHHQHGAGGFPTGSLGGLDGVAAMINRLVETAGPPAMQIGRAAALRAAKALESFTDRLDDAAEDLVERLERDTKED